MEAAINVDGPLDQLRGARPALDLLGQEGQLCVATPREYGHVAVRRKIAFDEVARRGETVAVGGGT